MKPLIAPSSKKRKSLRKTRFSDAFSSTDYWAEGKKIKQKTTYKKNLSLERQAGNSGNDKFCPRCGHKSNETLPSFRGGTSHPSGMCACAVSPRLSFPPLSRRAARATSALLPPRRSTPPFSTRSTQVCPRGLMEKASVSGTGNGGSSPPEGTRVCFCCCC